MNCLALYNKVEHSIGNLFSAYASLVCRRPWFFIFIPLMINGLLGIGLVNLKSNNDVEQLYTPSNSQASKDRATLQRTFADFSISNFYVKSEVETGLYGDIIFESKTKQQILQANSISEMKHVVHEIESMKYDAARSFSDVCAIRNNKCVVNGNIIFSSWFSNHLSANNIPYPGTGSNSLEGIFGDTIVVGNILRDASVAKFRFHLRHNSETSVSESKKWMDKFLTKMKTITGNNTNIFYAHSNSRDEELNANVSGDIVFFSLTFLLMIVYATVATSNRNCISERRNLGRAGVIGVTFSILGAFGLCSACGLEFVSIVGVMPFLIMGIGLDDMFLLLSGLAETYNSKKYHTPETRICATMRSSGVGITITTITDLLAFFIGATSSFKSVRNFCVYTGVAVLFCYLNYVTFYISCMYLHEKRVAEKKHYCTCQPITVKKLENPSRIEDQVFNCCCTGILPNSRDDVESFLEKYPAQKITEYVLRKPIKIIILLLFGVYIGFSIWGSLNFQQGLVLKSLVSDDSYYYKYSELNEKYFSTRYIISVTIPTEIKYSDNATWIKVSKLQDSLQGIKEINSVKSINWYQNFRLSAGFDGSSEHNFIASLRSKFLPTSPQFKNDIKFDSANTSIVASRFYIFSNQISESSEQGKLMTKVREVTASSQLPNAIVYAPAFIFFEQYVAILPNTLQTLGIAIAAIFVVTAIFLPHPGLIFFVTLTLAMILIGLFGFMYFWHLTLSSITMIHIIMSVGFSVDFSAHICHGFMETASTDRNDGAKGALRRAGGPIFNGAMSSIIGIILLVLSKSYIFRSFFKVMLLIISFGAAHSLLLLPVVLSICGPRFSPKKASTGIDNAGLELQSGTRTRH